MWQLIFVSLLTLCDFLHFISSWPDTITHKVTPWLTSHLEESQWTGGVHALFEVCSSSFFSKLWLFTNSFPTPNPQPLIAGPSLHASKFFPLRLPSLVEGTGHICQCPGSAWCPRELLPPFLYPHHLLRVWEQPRAQMPWDSHGSTQWGIQGIHLSYRGSLGFSGWAASIGFFHELDLGLACSLFTSFLFIPGSASLRAIICLCTNLHCRIFFYRV